MQIIESSAAASVEEKLSYTIPEASALSGISRSDIYRAFRAGQLPAKKRGKRTLILAADLRQFLASLPDWKPEASCTMQRAA
jgi:excisionase family DNA binding protein